MGRSLTMMCLKRPSCSFAIIGSVVWSVEAHRILTCPAAICVSQTLGNLNVAKEARRVFRRNGPANFRKYDLRHGPNGRRSVGGLTNARGDPSDETGNHGRHNRQCRFPPGNGAIRTGGKRDKSNPEQRADKPETKKRASPIHQAITRSARRRPKKAPQLEGVAGF